jgi:hypothetical protein
MGPRWEQVESLVEQYSDLPAEAIFKEDILRTGVAFSEDALRVASGYKPKAYFIFSFDLVPISEMDRQENLRVPEEICLVGGSRGFRRTIISVRVNPSSPYKVEISDEGRLRLTLETVEVCGVKYPDAPDYYGKTLSNGKPITDIAPSIEWGYLLYLTVFRLCHYHARKDECKFCDINENINENYRQQKKTGRSYTAVKTVGEVLEALSIIHETDSDSGAYTVTGGSITSSLNGLREVEFYSRYPEAIEKKFPGRWISKVVVQALPKSEAQMLKDAGVQIYHPNYEIWDPEGFRAICPGKEEYIGRDVWIERILDAGQIFGPRYVIPNFVAGIEMAKPFGFKTVEEAIASTAEGLDFFMAKGIVPRFTTWCPEPITQLGAENPGGAPLEYHVSLLRTWRDLLEKHRLQAPPGYGEPGIGQAVFSVSSFMDVVRVGVAKNEDEEISATAGNAS